MKDPPPVDNNEKKQTDEGSTFASEGSGSAKEDHESPDQSSKSTESKEGSQSRLIPIVTTPKRGISGASSSDDDEIEDDTEKEMEEDDDIFEGRKTKIPSFHNSQGTPVRGSSNNRMTTAPGSDGSAPGSPSSNPSSSAGTSAASVPADQERQILLLMLLAQVCALHDPTPRTFTVHVLELFERGILGRQSIHFLFELGLVPSNTPRLLPPSTTGATAALDDDSKEEILDLATVPSSSSSRTPTPTSPQTLRAQEASAIRMHLEHLDLVQQQQQQDQQQNTTRANNLFHQHIPQGPSTLVESPKAAAGATAKPKVNPSSWAVEHHPLSLSRYQREFHQVRLLNAGSFGEVFQSRHKIDLKDYAVKRVAFSAWGYSKDSVSQVIREVHCLAQCDHANVVRYYTSWLEPSWMTGSGATTTMMTSGGSKAEVRRQQKLLTDIQHMMVSGADAADASSHNHNHRPSASTNTDSFQEDAAALRDRQFSIGSSIDSLSFDSAASSYDETSSSEEEDDDRDNNNNNNNNHDWSVDDTTNRGDDSILFASSSHPQQREVWESSTSAPPPPRKAHQKKAKDAAASRIKYRYQICLFITMQLCHPATLGDWIRHRNAQCPDPNKDRAERVETAFCIFNQIASGLAHIHKKNIVHRDLKPHNLFRSLEDEGVFLIGDFGLSKLIESATHQQCTKKMNKNKNENQQQSPVFSSPTVDRGAMVLHQAPIELTEGVGTASYAAPEQVTTRTYGKRADIFSLGLILLELMCCFTTEHERMQTFYDCRHRRDIPAWISEKYPVAGKAILDCTHPNPSKRPAAEELLALDLLHSSSAKATAASAAAASAAAVSGNNNIDEVNELKLELEQKNEKILAYQQELKEKDDTIAKLQQELAQLKLQHQQQQQQHNHTTTTEPSPQRPPGPAEVVDCVGLASAAKVDVESSSSSSEDGV